MILYACSTNPGKLKEFTLASRSLHVPDLAIEPLPKLGYVPAPEENAESFEENACIKAIYYSAFTPELVFAEDSGLEVNALGGAPGVPSARYASPDATDEANNELLMRNLATATERTARFVCVIALARAGEVLQTFRGTVDGEILRTPRGASGFGYDPLFYYPPLGCSFAELTPEHKFAVSHRGNALRALVQSLAQENFKSHFG
jgi:XTP/dITP diphosphohydrolase